MKLIIYFESVNNTWFTSLFSILNEVFVAAERVLIYLIRVNRWKLAVIKRRFLVVCVSPLYSPFRVKSKNWWSTIFGWIRLKNDRWDAANATSRAAQRNLNEIFLRSSITVADGYRPRPCMNFNRYGQLLSVLRMAKHARRTGRSKRYTLIVNDD